MTCEYDKWWEWPWTAHDQGVKYSGPQGLEVYYNARGCWLHYNKSCECELCKSHKNTDARLRTLRDTDRVLARIKDAKTPAARLPLAVAAMKDGSITKEQGMELLSITVICKI